MHLSQDQLENTETNNTSISGNISIINGLQFCETSHYPNFCTPQYVDNSYFSINWKAFNLKGGNHVTFTIGALPDSYINLPLKIEGLLELQTYAKWT